MFIGRETNHSRRWIDMFAGFKIQPSEFMKLAMILALSKWFANVSPCVPTVAALMKLPILSMRAWLTWIVGHLFSEPFGLHPLGTNFVHRFKNTR